MANEKIKILGAILSYHLNRPANPACLPHYHGKGARLAGLFSLQLKSGYQGFDFFNYYWC